MQSFHVSFSPFLALSLLFLSSFHRQLVNGAQSFDFASGKLDNKSLSHLQNGAVDPASGTLTLNSSTGDAQAFYSNTINLLSTTQSVLSFSSFFTFASNAASGNGTIAFVITPEVAGGLTGARETLTIEFNTNCSTGVFGDYNGGHAFPGRGGGYRWGGGSGPFGGRGGFQVIEYANNLSISQPTVDGYGPNWSPGQPPQYGPYFCSQQTAQDLSNPTFQYQVIVEYNASTGAVWVGTPSCSDGIVLTANFTPSNLSGIITTPVNVGFIVSGGGIFNITQWNFTNNVNTSSTVFSLAVSSAVSSTSGGSSDGSMDGRRGHSDGKLKKGYVIAFSVLGAAIGVAAVLLVCCLCMRRKRVTSARFVAKSVHGGTIPESAVVFDAKKPHAPPAKVVLVDRDTTPLNTHPNSTTGTASWLQPVAPR